MTVLSYAGPILTGLIAIALIVWPEKDTGNIRFLNPRRWVGLGYLILFCVQPLNHIAYGEITLDALNPTYFDPMVIVCLLSLIAFVAGWLITGASSSTVPSRPLTSARTAVVIGALSVPAAISLALIVTAFQGLSGYLVDTAAVNTRVSEATYNIMTWLFSATVVIGIVSIASICQRRDVVRMSAVAFLSVVTSMMISIRLAARLRILFILLALLGTLATTIRPARFRALILAAAILLPPLFYVQRITRHDFSYATNVSDIVDRVMQRTGDLYYDFFMRGDFDAFENGMQLVRAVPYYHEFLLGSTLASVLINPIPRAIWEDKPSPSVTEILASTGFGRGSGVSLNVACSLPAELYVNFWWGGVVVGMFLFGWIAKRYYERRRLSADPIVGAEVGLFSAYLLLVLRGSFHVMTIYYIMILTWLWASRWLLSRDTRVVLG